MTQFKVEQEEQARKYAYDEEERLPQPDVLETAKACREHKAKPAMRKFQKVYLAINVGCSSASRPRCPNIYYRTFFSPLFCNVPRQRQGLWISIVYRDNQ